MKACKDCNEPLTPERLIPGQRRCRFCRNAADRAKYHANREKAIARVLAYNKAHPEKHAASQTAYRRRHPDKQRAHSAVAKAIRQGMLVRTACQLCGSGDDIQAHHHSYEQEHWLDVVWLCGPCHMANHRAPRVTLRLA